MTPPRHVRRPNKSGPRHAPSTGASAPYFVYGLHSVAAALANPARVCQRLMASENALRRLNEMVGPITVPVETAAPRALDRIAGTDAVHQGALLYCEPLPEPDLLQILTGSLVLFLDQVTDPHNVGAILRTATAFAVDGIVMTARHSPAETGVLAKAATGGLEHTPLARVRNLGDAMTEARDAGFALIGLDSEAPETMEQAIAPLGPSGRVALALGAEGKGLRQKTRGLCDHLARFDLPGPIASLNVSNATALALYVATRARRG